MNNWITEGERRRRTHDAPLISADILRVHANYLAAGHELWPREWPETVEAWAQLPVTRYQSPKWHINIIAKECGRRPRRFSQSLRIFALPARLCDCQTHKGRRILFLFSLSFLLLVFHFSFFIFVVLSALWTFTQGLAYLRACESAKKNGKSAQLFDIY